MNWSSSSKKECLSYLFFMMKSLFARYITVIDPKSRFLADDMVDDSKVDNLLFCVYSNYKSTRLSTTKGK